MYFARFFLHTEDASWLSTLSRFTLGVYLKTEMQYMQWKGLHSSFLY